MNKATVNIVIALAVAGILLYLAENNTTLVLFALGGLGYLLFANGIVRVAA